MLPVLRLFFVRCPHSCDRSKKRAASLRLPVAIIALRRSSAAHGACYVCFLEAVGSANLEAHRRVRAALEGVET